MKKLLKDSVGQSPNDIIPNSIGLDLSETEFGGASMLDKFF